MDRSRARVPTISTDLSRPARAPIAVQRYIYPTNSRKERSHVLEGIRGLARRAFQMRRPDTSRVNSIFIDEAPVPNEPELDAFAYGAYVGPPDDVIPRLVNEMNELNVIHLSCFTHMEDLDVKNSVRAMEDSSSSISRISSQPNGMQEDIRRYWSKVPSPIFAVGASLEPACRQSWQDQCN